MNKKILAIAIGAAMMVPVAAQADLKVSARLQSELTSSGTLAMGDLGQSRIDFVAKNDDGGFKYGMDARDIGGIAQRENYVWLNLGGAKITLGRPGNAFNAGHIDPLKATFLEARKAGAYLKPQSFISDTVGVSMKAGDMKIGFQYEVPGGEYHFGVSGKAGGFGYGFGYELDGGITSYRLAGKMKFGGINVGAEYASGEAADFSGGAAGVMQTALFVDVNGKIGGGMSWDVAIGQNITAPSTFYRVAITKKMSKKTRINAGFVSASGTSTFGVGVRVDS